MSVFLWQKVGHITAKGFQLPYQRAAHVLQARLGENKNRFYASKLAVEVGLRALILIVLHVAHAPDKILSPLALRHVDGQIAVSLHHHARFVAIYIGYGAHPLLHLLIGVLQFAYGYGDNQSVEKIDGAVYDRLMPYGERVEGARK